MQDNKLVQHFGDKMELINKKTAYALGKAKENQI